MDREARGDGGLYVLGTTLTNTALERPNHGTEGAGVVDPLLGQMRPASTAVSMFGQAVAASSVVFTTGSSSLPTVLTAVSPRTSALAQPSAAKHPSSARTGTVGSASNAAAMRTSSG